LKTTEVVENLVKGIVNEAGFELCDVEFQKEAGNWVLTLFIDKEGGVDIDDCETVSRLVDPILDEADPIDQAYYLSVSSLGIDRPLKKAADYVRSAGKELEVRLYAPQNGKKQLIGILESFTDEDFTLLTEDGKQITILKKDAALVRPHIRF